MTMPRGECRICDRDSAVNTDEEIHTHKAGPARCPGSGRPPKGEPPCGFTCGRMGGSVHYPADLFTRADLMKVSHAATYVCFDPEHQAEAAEWVRSKTGHKGVYAPWKPLAPAAQDATDAPDKGSTSMEVTSDGA